MLTVVMKTSATTSDATNQTEENVLDNQSNTSNKQYTTKQEIIDKIKTLASSETVPSREEIESLKSTFYRIHLAEREAEQKLILKQEATLRLIKWRLAKTRWYSKQSYR